MDYVRFGARVKQLRKARKWTQEELARRSDISLSFLGHIERGTRKASLETLIQLANALGTSADLLLQDVLDTEHVINCQKTMLREISRILISNREAWADEQLGAR